MLNAHAVSRALVRTEKLSGTDKQYNVVGALYLFRRSSVTLLALALGGCGAGVGSTNEPSDPPALARQEIVGCTPPKVIGQCFPAPSADVFPCTCVDPPPPPAQTFTLVPDFYITHVIYAPPGRSSSINYASSSSVGTTTSATHGIKDDVKVSAEGSGGIFAGASVNISAGAAFGNSKTDATDVTVSYSQGYKKSGQIDAIDHSYDEVWFLIRPALSVSYQPAGTSSSQPAKIAWKFAPDQDEVNNAIQQFVYVGWLTNAMQMPSDVKALLDFYNITPKYYPTLLAADPLASGMAPNQGMDPDRYDFIGGFPFEPPFAQGDQPSTQMYSVDQKINNSSSTTVDENYSVGFSVTGGADVGAFKAKLTVADTWTWTNSSTTKESNGSGSTDTFTVGQPAFGYKGPTTLHVFEDKIYKTYAFTLDFVPTCSGSCGGQASAGCWCDASCERYGDCCSDAPVQCGSCAGACEGESAAGCWCDSSCAQNGNCCTDSLPLCGV